jgi:hypothetical protein
VAERYRGHKEEFEDWVKRSIRQPAPPPPRPEPKEEKEKR